VIRELASVGVLAAVSFIISLLGTAQEIDGLRVPLCSIAENPVRYDGKTIRVKAQLHSAGMHGWYIYDEGCPQFGVGLFIPSKVDGSEELHRAVNWGEFGTTDKTVSASFVGVFHLNKPPQSPPRELIVRRMENFKSTPKTK